MYSVSGRSHAVGVDPETVMDAFRGFVHALDAATAGAGDDGTLFEGSIAGSDWIGDNEKVANAFELTAQQARQP